MTRTAKAPRGADYKVSYIFPKGTVLTGYTGTLIVYTEPNGATLLTVTNTPNPNGSFISFDANLLSVDIKNADIIALPTDASDSENPNLLFFNLTTNTGSDLVKVDGGPFLVLPYGAPPAFNTGDVIVTLDGLDITVEVAATGFDTAVLSVVNDAAAAAALSAYDANASANAAQVSAGEAAADLAEIEDLILEAQAGPFVSYQIPQPITATQQKQARTNIGAYAVYNIPTTTADYTTSVAAFLATTTANTLRIANTAQKPLFWPSGSNTGGAGAVISVTGAGQTVVGAGRASVVQTTGYDINEFNTTEVRDHSLIGAGAYGIQMRTTSGRIQIPSVANMYIQDKTVGILVNANSTVNSVAYGQISQSTLFSCATAISLTNPVNYGLVGVQTISSTVSDFVMTGGGEVKMANCSFQGGGSGAAFTISGSSSSNAVESYFTNVNMNQGGNTDLVPGTVAPYAGGSQLLFTTTGAVAHKCIPGWTSFNMTSANYGTANWTVANVLADDQVVLQVGTTAQAPGTYSVSESATFNRQRPGLLMTADSIGNTNDMFFFNSSSNNTEINNVFNSVWISRGLFSKQRPWFYGSNNRLLSIGSARGRDGLSGASAGDILPGGPASHTGWSHLGIFDETAQRNPGGVRTGSLSPMKDWGVGSNNMTVGYAVSGTSETGPFFGTTSYTSYRAGTIDQIIQMRRPAVGDQQYLDATAVFRVTTDNKVNMLQIVGANTGTRPAFAAYSGTDADVGITYQTQGTGYHEFFTGSTPARQFRVGDTAGATEYVQVTGGSAIATVLATGAAAAVTLSLRSTGAGSAVRLRGGGATWIDVIGASGTVDIGAAGTDTNSDITISPKGTGAVRVGYGASNNHFVFTPSAAGFAPTLAAAGTDTNISPAYYSKGTGSHDFYTGATSARQFRVVDFAGATTYVQVNGGGAVCSILPNGTDTNARMDLWSKGTSIIALRAGGGTRQVQVSDTGIGFYGTIPVAKPSITGVLSAVTDANAKAVLTSIISALSITGFATNSTT